MVRTIAPWRPAVASMILAVILLLLAACTSPATPSARLPLTAASATPGPLALTIVHSNDSWGYLDPCG